MAIDISRHPCFNKSCKGTFGRIHLPIAPKCNVQCNFCNRKYDCVNESRPGVTSSVLTPGQAMAYLDYAVERDPRITVVGIAGPGDPFANPKATMETLRRVRAKYPDMLLCVATNGLNVIDYVDELAELKVSHLTITISAVDPDLAGQIYSWIRHDKKVYRGRAAGELMIARQMEAIRAIKTKDILLKINTIVMPTINDTHVLEVARTVAAEGVDILNCMALCQVPGTPFERITPPTNAEMADLRLKAREYLPQMTHCTRCRADAVGLLGEKMPPDLQCCLQKAAAGPLEPQEDRPNVAVATLEGVLVNQHLGEAQSLSIFAPLGETGYKLIDRRPAPAPGAGQARWSALADVLDDCRAVLCSGAGDKPTQALAQHGIRTIVMEGLIEEGLEAIYRNRTIRAPLREHACGVGCSGDGAGCG